MKRKYSWDAKKLYQAQKKPATGLQMRLNKQANARAMVVPGYTRTGGPYRRALPRNGEIKFVDTSFNIGSVGTTGATLASNLVIPVGTGDQQRIGAKVNLKDFMITFALSNDDLGTGAVVSGNVRVVVVLDRQANGALPAWADVFDLASLSSFRNLDNVDRFKILKDQIINVPIRTTNALHTDQTGYWKRWYFKCNLPLHYSSTTGAVTEMKSNNIAVMYIGDNATVNFVGTVRAKYTDL